MNKKAYVVAAVIAIIVVIFAYLQFVKPQLDDRMVSVTVPMTITSVDFPLEFTYPSGEDAYTLIEPPVSTSTIGGPKKVYLIMSNQDYIDFQSRSVGGEAPPAVSVFVFKAPEIAEGEKDSGRITRLQNWANQYTQYSSFQLINTEPEIVELDGVGALKYRTDGLYQQEVHLVSHRDHIYVFTGQFNDETDEIYTMYRELIQSVILN